MDLLPILKLLVIFVLFFAFLLEFAIPAFQRYSKEDVIVLENSLESESIQTPAVTICIDQAST